MQTITKFLSDDEYLLVKNYIDGLSWTYLDRTEHEKIPSGTGFSHNIWIEGDSTDWSNRNAWLMKLLYLKISKYFKIEDFIRVKANMLLPRETDHRCPAHIDTNREHWAAIVYFSTEKEGYGETVLYNQSIDMTTLVDPVDVVKESDGLTVNKLIPCKENTAVIFNGNILHAATYPKNIKRRIVLNIDFTGTPHGNT